MKKMETKLPFLIGQRNGGLNPTTKISVIRHAIESRTTSRAEDVPLCAASLFGKDITPIASGPSDIQSRYKAFYILVGQVPDGVLRTDQAERLTIRPFRWAPASITACPLSTLKTYNRDYLCDEQGLHVRHAGFMIDGHKMGNLCRTMPTQGWQLTSSETGEIHGTLSIGGHRDCKEPARVPLPLPDVILAVITLTKGGEAWVNAVVIQVEHKCTDADGDVEIHGTILDYRNFSPNNKISGSEDGAEVYCTTTPEGQKWCLT